MSMFFHIVADGRVNKKGQTPHGLDNFTEPEVFTRKEILEDLLITDVPDLILDKSVCKQVQVIDTWTSDNYYYEELIVKAMGYQQALDLAKEYGKTKAPNYFERQKAISDYKEQVRKTKEAAKKVVGYGYATI